MESQTSKVGSTRSNEQELNLASAQVQESIMGARATPLNLDSPIDLLLLMSAQPQGVAYEAVPVTQRSPIQIDLPPMPTTIPGLESYFRTLRRGMEDITPREPEVLVGFLNP